ncbi:uncharacterized protein CCOS01_16762 [Colletotrichum costaricense]|uniref:Uncharacterized protein n=1 Tax=Colletotrichum costaricense TaxID=1209916 RepID=A0AAJ0DRR7_9PEZI|nr:uncharacterized protein CCOS01_16762 [Colletotrichum costaricense]KAK1505188.1 hypothetical protein CCOS01_16762 [Colletotrichum costaricense]
MQDTSARGWAECHGAAIGWRVQLKPERMGYRIGNENLEGRRRSATFDTRAWTRVQQDGGRRTNEQTTAMRSSDMAVERSPGHPIVIPSCPSNAMQPKTLESSIPFPPSRLFSAHTPFPWIPDPEPLGPENSSRANQGKTAEQRGKAAVQTLRLGVGTREVRRCGRKQTRLTKPRVPEQQTISRNWKNGPPRTQDAGRGTWDAEVRRGAKQSRAESRGEHRPFIFSLLETWRPGLALLTFFLTCPCLVDGDPHTWLACVRLSRAFLALLSLTHFLLPCLIPY